LENGIIFCRVTSCLTGDRLVSLPFSDHCNPLVGDNVSLRRLLAAVTQRVLDQKLAYLEIRPVATFDIPMSLSGSLSFYSLHQLDLRPDLQIIFQNCHKDSIQRKIRKSERGGLRYEEGRSPSHLNDFYHLLLLTRRRHQVPPQPRKWFQNLISFMGDKLKIRLAYRNGEAAAAILTLRHNDTLVYKYGCSDTRFHHLGPVQLLFWRAIEDAKYDHLNTFDFGRSSIDNPGLITFKDRWGTVRSTLIYSRYGIPESFRRSTLHAWAQRIGERVLPYLPDGVLEAVGGLLYRHIG
jgi:CelD/BcsL family acetyltransferase involved in cellulose biosynthesis